MGKKFTFNAVSKGQGTRWGWYGRGGAGKTTSALNRALKCTKGKVAVVDAEASLAPLSKTLESQGFDMSRVVVIPAVSVEDLLDILRDRESFDGIGSIIIDSMTTIDGWYTTYICKHFKPDPKSGGMLYSDEGFNPPMRSRESFGFGKDNTAAYETNEFILAALDGHIADGRDVHLIMHECDIVTSDARGDAKITIPRLQNPVKNPKNSIASRVREWVDNLGYLFRSRETDESGRVISVGNRMVAFDDVGTGIPGFDGTFWAKGRTISGIHQISDLGNKAKSEVKNESEVK